MYQRLQPILHLQDLSSEQDFYLRLGFTLHYATADFVAFSHGDAILFGLQQDPAGDAAYFSQQMEWQFGVTDVQAVATLCEAAALPILEPLHQTPWGEWVVVVQSPNGYRVVFEGPLT